MTSVDNGRSSRAPKSESERIVSLMQRISDGDIKLPTFQRPQVWNIDQVIDLLDSIYQGYPVGSLLFWRTDTFLLSERDIGGFSLPATPEKYPRNYILDGQQRLTALYAVLSFPIDRIDERFRVVYDLENHKFIEAKEAVKPKHLPLNVLYDTSKYTDFIVGLGEHDASSGLIAETQSLWEVFHEYAIPVVTVLNAPIDQVGVIFERINSRGTRLTIFDLMVAATWGAQKDEEFNLRSNVREVLDQLGEKDYGGIEDVTVLRSLSVVDTRSARRDMILSLRNHSHTDLELLIEKTRSALARATDFLVSECSAVSSDSLPYERQLMLLTYVMADRSSLSADEIQVLRKWFWRTSFSERYRVGGEALFDEDLNVSLKMLGSPDEIRRYGQAPSRDFFISSEFRKPAAASKAFAAFLGFHEPMKLTNGARIDVGEALSEYNRKEFHHLFPQRVLKGWGTNKELVSSLANICMLTSSENKKIRDKLPSVYMSELKEQLGSQFESVMESNLIPPKAVDLTLQDKYTDFLEVRAHYLAERVAALN